MSTPTSGDLLLVNRGGVNYQIDYDDMSTLQDTDLLLVNRAGTNYQIAASDINLGPDGLILPPVEVLTPVNGAGLNEGDPYTPLSSAYVSTDSTPIYYRYFPIAITTVSGGAWVDENNIFDGSTSNYATLGGAADVVSQATYTNLAEYAVEGETTVYAYAAGGGTIEVIDENDTVLRTYQLPTTAGSTAIGIVRADNQIRFTTAVVNTSLLIGEIQIDGTPTVDYIISGRVAFQFADDTDLDKMVAPIIMTDENGNIKVPTTSTVDSTTSIPGETRYWDMSWGARSTTFTYSGPTGPRMIWTVTDDADGNGVIDNVSMGDAFLAIYQSPALISTSGTNLADGSTSIAPSRYTNSPNGSNFITEIGVAPKVLDIVTYTGNGVGGRAIPHNLGVHPGMIIIKSLTNSTAWMVWHKDLEFQGFVRLNLSSIAGTSSSYFQSNPTRDEFYIGSDSGLNAINTAYVAYIYAADTPEKVKCGSYIGVGSGQNVSVGFEPGFLLIKNIDSAENWVGQCAATEIADRYWHPNLGQLLQTGGPTFSGSAFYVPSSAAEWNGSGDKHIYLAVAKDLLGPNSTQLNLLSGQDLEYFTDGTQITTNLAGNGSRVSFAGTTYAGNGSGKIINPVAGGQVFFDTRPETDNKWLLWTKSTTAGYSHAWVDSERNKGQVLSSDTTSISYVESDEVYKGTNGAIGYSTGSSNMVNISGTNYIAWSFLTASQFFDIQKYAGDSTASTSNRYVINHDLGVEPGCIILKSVSNNGTWYVWHHTLPSATGQRLNVASSLVTIGSQWMNVDDTSFSFGTTGSDFNAVNGIYNAYLFAKDTPYVKCGEYTGAGAGTQVNVGFQPRWMMIKESNGTGGWYIFDKNMASGTYLEADRAGVLLTGLPWSFTSTGISLTTGDSGINGSGNLFMYIAIADEIEGHPPEYPSSSTVKGTPDVNTATMVVDAESFDVGDSASAPALDATIPAVAGSDGNILYADNPTGTWFPGLYAKGSEITLDAPSPDEVVFTSMNQGTTPFSGVDATLSSRTWTLESGPSATGPWTVVDTYVDFDALGSQDGASPWSTTKPDLAPNTFYRVKCQYDSTNAESVESVYHTFKTSV